MASNQSRGPSESDGSEKEEVVAIQGVQDVPTESVQTIETGEGVEVVESQESLMDTSDNANLLPNPAVLNVLGQDEESAVEGDEEQAPELVLVNPGQGEEGDEADDGEQVAHLGQVGLNPVGLVQAVGGNNGNDGTEGIRPDPNITQPAWTQNAPLDEWFEDQLGRGRPKKSVTVLEKRWRLCAKIVRKHGMTFVPQLVPECAHIDSEMLPYHMLTEKRWKNLFQAYVAADFRCPILGCEPRDVPIANLTQPRATYGGSVTCPRDPISTRMTGVGIAYMAGTRTPSSVQVRPENLTDHWVAFHMRKGLCLALPCPLDSIGVACGYQFTSVRKLKLHMATHPGFEGRTTKTKRALGREVQTMMVKYFELIPVSKSGEKIDDDTVAKQEVTGAWIRGFWQSMSASPGRLLHVELVKEARKVKKTKTAKGNEAARGTQYYPDDTCKAVPSDELEAQMKRDLKVSVKVKRSDLQYDSELEDVKPVLPLVKKKAGKRAAKDVPLQGGTDAPRAKQARALRSQSQSKGTPVERTTDDLYQSKNPKSKDKGFVLPNFSIVAAQGGDKSVQRSVNLDETESQNSVVLTSVPRGRQHGIRKFVTRQAVSRAVETAADRGDVDLEAERVDEEVVDSERSSESRSRKTKRGKHGRRRHGEKSVPRSDHSTPPEERDSSPTVIKGLLEGLHRSSVTKREAYQNLEQERNDLQAMLAEAELALAHEQRSHTNEIERLNREHILELNDTQSKLVDAVMSARLVSDALRKKENDESVGLTHKPMSTMKKVIATLKVEKAEAVALRNEAQAENALLRGRVATLMAEAAAQGRDGPERPTSLATAPQLDTMVELVETVHARENQVTELGRELVKANAKASLCRVAMAEAQDLYQDSHALQVTAEADAHQCRREWMAARQVPVPKGRSAKAKIVYGRLDIMWDPSLRLTETLEDNELERMTFLGLVRSLSETIQDNVNQWQYSWRRQYEARNGNAPSVPRTDEDEFIYRDMPAPDPSTLRTMLRHWYNRLNELQNTMLSMCNASQGGELMEASIATAPQLTSATVKVYGSESDDHQGTSDAQSMDVDPNNNAPSGQCGVSKEVSELAGRLGDREAEVGRLQLELRNARALLVTDSATASSVSSVDLNPIMVQLAEIRGYIAEIKRAEQAALETTVTGQNSTKLRNPIGGNPLLNFENITRQTNRSRGETVFVPMERAMIRTVDRALATITHGLLSRIDTAAEQDTIAGNQAAIYAEQQRLQLVTPVNAPRPMFPAMAQAVAMPPCSSEFAPPPLVITPRPERVARVVETEPSSDDDCVIVADDMIESGFAKMSVTAAVKLETTPTSAHRDTVLSPRVAPLLDRSYSPLVTAALGEYMRDKSGQPLPLLNDSPQTRLVLEGVGSMSLATLSTQDSPSDINSAEQSSLSVVEDKQLAPEPSAPDSVPLAESEPEPKEKEDKDEDVTPQ